WKREGIRAWKALSQAFESGKLPAGELTDAALVLVGGILLMLPGFLSDVMGLFFLLPFTRPLARRLVAAVVGRTAARRGLDLGVLRAKAQPDSVIKGETVEAPSRPTSTPSDPVVLKGEIES
ncbi:MAG TPA: FxsA family protein, partial [Propionibacteriaceae bacterium]|nr:FxsA family protein [Propionibacteriaceae bacterium]